MQQPPAVITYSERAWKKKKKKARKSNGPAVAGYRLVRKETERRKRVSKSEETTVNYGFANSELVSKKDANESRKRNASGAAIAGAGATAAGAGLYGGGIPGVKPDAEAWEKGVKADAEARVNREPGRSRKQRFVDKTKAFKGGEFGLRVDAHKASLDEYKGYKKLVTEEAPNFVNNRNVNRADVFRHGNILGSIKPEEKVIRHLKGARLASHGLLASGAVAGAYGVHRATSGSKHKSGVSKSDRTDRYSGAALGVGGTTAVGAATAQKVLRSQDKKWNTGELDNVQRAQDLVPRLRTDLTNKHVLANADLVFRGKSKKVVEEAGLLRGEAAQERHMARQYKMNAKLAGKLKYPSLAVAAAGAGGLLAGSKKDKNAFGVNKPKKQ